MGVALLCLLATPTGAENHESFWGAQEFYTQKRHLRYLLLFPPNYDAHRKYELWVNLHGVGLRRAARHTPMFFAAGQADPYAGPYFRITSRKLRELGFELRTVNPPGIGHALPPCIYEPLLKFMGDVRARKT